MGPHRHALVGLIMCHWKPLQHMQLIVFQANGLAFLTCFVKVSCSYSSQRWKAVSQKFFLGSGPASSTFNNSSGHAEVVRAEFRIELRALRAEVVFPHLSGEGC